MFLKNSARQANKLYDTLNGIGIIQLFHSLAKLESTMATIRDVAKKAGVAPMTVSRVLNNSGYVSPETRSRVEAAAAELNYVPNMLARSFRSKRTDTLALIITDITNPFWTTVARGVEDEANQQGYTVIFCNTDESEEQAGAVPLHACQPAGRWRAVDAGQQQSRTGRNASTAGRGSRWSWTVALPGADVDVVRSASTVGARLLTAYLIEQGHRRIAMLSGPRLFRQPMSAWTATHRRSPRPAFR